MASEVTSAPPELRVPVTMCSVMCFLLPTKKGIMLPFPFPQHAPPPTHTRLLSLSGSQEGARPGCLHPEFCPHHMLHVYLSGWAWASGSASAEWGAAQTACEGWGIMSMSVLRVCGSLWLRGAQLDRVNVCVRKCVREKGRE